MKILNLIFNWIFKAQIKELNDKVDLVEKMTLKAKGFEVNAHIHSQNAAKTGRKLEEILEGMDCSVDVNHYSPSWAVISIQGKQNFIKFVDLGRSDIEQISRFLSRFDRQKVDANPGESRWILAESRARNPHIF